MQGAFLESMVVGLGMIRGIKRSVRRQGLWPGDKFGALGLATNFATELRTILPAALLMLRWASH